MHTLHYAGGHLDRAGRLRNDPAWVADRLGRPNTRLVPFWRSRNLIRGLNDPVSGPMAVICTGAVSSDMVEAASEITFLGLEEDVAVFGVDLSGWDERAVTASAGGGELVDLRRAGGLMNAREAALLAYARGMLLWHQSHRFCGQCGQPTESRHGGHVRVCTATACGRETFPRTDPAVIMLVEHRPPNGGSPTCLLGRRGAWPAGTYSTLAGFVEPGESLEEAVAREVLEEAAVRVVEVTYQASQPWPFPASIMLGFRARAETTAICVDREELEDARWFTADELRQAGEWGDDRARLRLPRRDAIARLLIDSWLGEEGGRLKT